MRRGNYVKKQINLSNKRFFYTKTQQANSCFDVPDTDSLNPWWVTGFSDGESSFIVTIYKNKEYKCGYQVQAMYSGASSVYIKRYIFII